MMILESFEIKIALLGYVSVGKTTVLNALLRDRYGEVSMRRTTAGINYFRLTARRGNKRSSDAMLSEGDNDAIEAGGMVSNQNATEGGTSPPDSMDWSVVGGEIFSAEATLKEITSDNASLRQSNALQSKTFDVEVEEDLVEMRKDTKLVVVDIPGINEAGASTKYKDYVAENWHNFDCVVVVMDAKQGVNTEDQVDLLNFVKTNLHERKKVPVIILGNKVDEPEDHEQGVLVSEVRSAVERIFETSCRKAALDNILDESNDGDQGDLFPAFIPISAIHAYIYQTASLMDFEKFKGFDNDLIEKLGREVVGSRRWKRISREDKYKEAFGIIADPALYQQGIEDSNFNKFLSVLEYCLGGEDTQRGLIAKQLEVARSLLAKYGCDGVSIAAQLQSICEKGRVLGESSEHLKDDFWNVYGKLETITSDEYKSPASVKFLANPLKQLIGYHSWAGQMGWDEEQELAETAMKFLVIKQTKSVFENLTLWLDEKELMKVSDNVSAELGWNDLSHLDWINILESFLLLSCNPYFCDIFGKEKIFMETLKTEITEKVVSWNAEANRDIVCDPCQAVMLKTNCNRLYCNSCGCYKLSPSVKVLNGANCPSCHHILNAEGCCSCCGTTYALTCKQADPLPSLSQLLKYQNGKFVSKHDTKYKSYIHVEVPDSIKDPSHFGHLAWKYCQFMSTIDNKHEE